MAEQAEFHDALIGPERTDLPAGFFDRFMFNMHPVEVAPGSPSIILGFGIYPPKDTTDGFLVYADGAEQRNLRFAGELGVTGRTGAGPLRYDVEIPNERWRLTLAANDIGVDGEIVWRSRTPAWWGEVAVDNATSTRTAFDHLFQSGTYTGTLRVDGAEVSLDGWYGQRDRSRGVRTMAGGQGLHIWFQAQFPEFSIGLLLVETRTGERLLLEGAVMHVAGHLDPITGVRHALTFDDGLDLTGGHVEVRTEAGRTYRVRADPAGRGGYMAGAGYGGHQGNSRGADHVESDRYPLDGSVSPRTLDSALTDRLCAFELDGTQGSGIFEFALTRSRSYTYRRTL
ncbi:hypothetical protein [Gordonia sp. (in: high G+C Gram-positive bacteria)]|uniref:DUF7064 domain-containing protein n=1 Tax=Gordonia sp. (in: high G+C Gram-positive bacteria) TaxID=84139 RepID=UPI0019C1EB7F|nr:hypothetical protein [Gordonia sp. (in: high G+C Gram-positive bacteria)]MBD0020778.1 hypothetical protein [Gordonia sp. (in: high G+C Gram-positive bacteria)]